VTGQVTIRFAMANSFSVDSADSRMAEFLQILGIGNVREMTGDLRIENVGISIDAQLILDIFPVLQHVNVLTIIGYRSDTPVASSRVFIGFPGFQKLDQVGGFLLARTSLPNLGSFSGLRCVGGMRFEDNILLTSLAGIQDVRVGIDGLRVGGDMTDLEIARQTKLVGPERLAPLQKMAGCAGGPVPGGTLFIDTACPDPIDSWAVLCDVLENSDCGARPPPPA
jgi:hypothetical protein